MKLEQKSSSLLPIFSSKKLYSIVEISFLHLIQRNINGFGYICMDT